MKKFILVSKKYYFISYWSIRKTPVENYYEAEYGTAPY